MTNGGWLSNGLANLTTFTGNELVTMDSESASGAAPTTGALSLQQVAMLASFYGNVSSKTTVAGTIYYATYVVTAPSATSGVVNLSSTKLLTGINILVGSVGGTDTWIAGLYNSAGVLVASSTLSGTTAGTANTWQQLAFTTAYSAPPGVYLIAIQSNGTTAHPAMFNFPAPAVTSSAPVLTGSQTGTAGTLAAIGTISTTYTANLGPYAFPYT